MVRFSREAARRRGLSLPLQDDHERRQESAARGPGIRIMATGIRTACSSRSSRSVFIAVDPATRENGCMQVIPGSHNLGRIDHVLTGDQAGRRPWNASTKFSSAAAGLCGDGARRRAVLPCQPAAPLGSEHSDNPRWSMICCYNAARNDPYKEAHHPRYTPLDKVPDQRDQASGPEAFLHGRFGLDECCRRIRARLRSPRKSAPLLRLEDVASKAKVSVSTVSRVVNGVESVKRPRVSV